MKQLYNIFGNLNQGIRRCLFFDNGKPEISEEMFYRFEWEGFYKGFEEPNPLDVLKPRGNPMSIHVFVNSYHAGDK